MNFVSLRAQMIGAVILIALLCGTPSSVGAQARVGVGAPGAGAPSMQSISKLTVFDAHGLEVGVLGNTLFQVNGRIFSVGVAPQGFVGFGRSFLLFENLDCQGPPFLSSSSADLGGFVTISALGPPGATVYLPDPAAPIGIKDFKSSLQFFPPACENFSALGPTTGVAAVPVFDLYTVFTPPFSVRPTPAPLVTAQIFNDVPPSHPFFAFIQALAAEGITIGCSVSPPLFCPDAGLTRGQAAVLFGKGLNLVP
jgi:hypothetical protein